MTLKKTETQTPQEQPTPGTDDAAQAAAATPTENKPPEPVKDSTAGTYLENLAKDFLKEVPEEFRGLIPPELTPQGKIDFIRAAQAKGLFSPAAPQNGQGAETPTRKKAPDYSGMSANELLRAGLTNK